MAPPQRTSLPRVARDAASPRESERDFYRLIAETVPQMVWSALPNGELDYVNARTSEYTGMPASALKGRSWRALVHAEDRGKVDAAWARALQGGEPFDTECRLRAADGSYRWHQASARPLRDARGNISRWYGTNVDIEERISATQLMERARAALEAMVEVRTRALREVEQRFQAFMDHAPAIAWIKDSRLRYVFISKPFEAAHDVRLADFVGRGDFELWPEEMAHRLHERDKEVLKTGRALRYIETVQVPGGPPSEWLTGKFPLPDASGALGVAGVAIDITERVEAEGKVRDYAGRVRQLLVRLTEAQEAERRRLAVDLHDLLGQTLTALGIELGVLEAGLSSESMRHTRPHLGLMRELLERSVESVRGVMSELRPPALDEYGLLPALHLYADEFGRRTGLDVSVAGIGPVRRLPREVELALFRIVQEALTNAAKHSGGRRIEVGVALRNGAVRVTVEDDGRGFADADGARAARRGGWGVPAMRERAEAHGGSLQIEFPGKGTRIIVEVPHRGD